MKILKSTFIILLVFGCLFLICSFIESTKTCYYGTTVAKLSTIENHTVNKTNLCLLRLELNDRETLRVFLEDTNLLNFNLIGKRVVIKYQTTEYFDFVVHRIALDIAPYNN